MTANVEKLRDTGVEAIDRVISDLKSDEKIIHEHKENIAGFESIRQEIEKPKNA